MEPTSTRHDFRAWLMDGDTFTAIYCPLKQTHITSGSYATCCPSASCKMVTACRDNTLYSDSGTGRFCGTRAGDQCGTVSIYQNYPSGEPIMTHIHCRLSTWGTIMYRELGATMTARSTAAATETDPLITEPPATSAPSDTPAPGPSESQSSKAWIAGAVIGPLAGIAIIGLVVFMVWRRRRRGAAGRDDPRKNGDLAEAPDSSVLGSAYAKSHGGPSPVGNWQQNPQPVYEMNGSYPPPPAELDSGTVYEMNGQSTTRNAGNGHI
ncbi:uncharacterized protein CTRU02_206369 [Colletotrichum truncatum]|uniref:Uncharacterized protein n=1 Tax=Colletotrichum truncatum TaxID=5467 RepID=A0ACC3Z6R1_COLTU|nr:uncharacterized protein CTRU02_09794 [Colletotrichum truncatum]KAF6787981.1 hypothetical protein CTRU02_09794 [Colletotrichum truncatum]